ncbi:ABC transporter ATP-binding protein [uncultured Sphaerochaeta sp.]|uniref:ABC transporter ATP-binding protein n=1 Tax=uncultured Sphaerochaeta sp. TaxID=886478 RepID=UPI002A0A3367|nr:ABC transporter ATP-binding protein [uncultured Sphaerochaeta sp.]
MIEIEHVTKTYAKHSDPAVKDLNIKIPDGKIFGFLGPNGAGKSTTIKMLIGILSPDLGTISLNSSNTVTQSLQTKAMIGYVPDEPRFYEKMTGRRHLEFICDIFKVTDEQRKERMIPLVQRFELEKALDEEISSYSHGMKQKLAVIAALIHKPKILILDEPMVGLDPKASFLLKETMKEYCKEGNTVFFSTHIMEVAQELCDLIGIINKGSLLFFGTVQELQNAKGEGSDSLERLFLELTDKEVFK